MIIARSVGSGRERLHLDAANTLAVNGSDLDVAAVAPGSAPRVSHDVVLYAALSSVADGSDGVVKIGTASGGVENSAMVHLEDRFVGFDGHCDDTLVEGGH